MVAGAEDDGLLQRVAVARGEQAVEQVRAHGLDALGHDEAQFQDSRLRSDAGDVIGRARLAPVRALVSCLAVEVLTQHAAHPLRLLLLVVEEVVGLDLRRGEVAIRHALQVGVFVGRLAEVVEVVGQQATVFLDLAAGFVVLRLGHPNLARRGGEADLNGVLVVLQDDKPVAPGGAVAFVNDDDIEEAGRVVLEEERGALATLCPGRASGRWR